MSNVIEVHEKMCLPRFEKIEGNQKEMQRDIGVIREKIFNGFSDSIARIESDVSEMKQREEKRKRSRALMVRDIMLALIGGGGIISLVIEHFLT